jgi:hypothetical protein
VHLQSIEMAERRLREHRAQRGASEQTSIEQ